MVKQAKAIGLDGIAITDHDTVEGMKLAKTIAKKLDIMLIPGLEITTPFGDILALGIEEVIEIKHKDKKMIFSIIDEIHSLGGIAIAAHPYGGYWPMKFADMNDILKRFDAIEVFNAFTSANFGIEANIKAMELANKLKLPGTASSDAHSLDMIGTAFTIPQSSNIITAIKKNKIKIGWL